MKKIKSIKGILLGLLGLGLLIGLDQLVKYWVYHDLRTIGRINLIPGVLCFAYASNDGAAWGMLSGARILNLLPIVIALILIYGYVCVPESKRFLPLNICMVVLTAGAIGNRIDRSVYGKVQDFIYFELIDFPVFNVADCYIVVSCIVMALLLLFYYKDENEFKGMFTPWKKD